jgi:hypothetical protein
MSARCRNCGLLERHHEADGIVYANACDDYQEDDTPEQLAAEEGYLKRKADQERDD